MRPCLLLTSIHDVGPRFEREVDALYGRLAGQIGEQRLAMLVVPDHWGEAPLARAPRFQARLRAWADGGVDMFVHGWFHKDTSVHGRVAAWKGAHLTAGEGEFLGLDVATARQRIADGRALIEDIIGRPAAGFIAPAWLYGKGAREALAASDLPMAEDHFRVWEPASGRILARGPVVTWATRSRMRLASSLAFARVAPIVLKPFSVARLAVHPGDAHSPVALRSIDRTLQALLRGRAAGNYRELSHGQRTPQVGPARSLQALQG